MKNPILVGVREHYDRLIDENNDPARDPEPLKAYMDKWDGGAFLDAMELDREKTVLEIGVGTGRLACKTAPLCKEFFGIDLSPRTVERAEENLSRFQNVTLICDDFMGFAFHTAFDVVYTSLTFMHVREKRACISKIYTLLKPKGRLVLSIDKNQSGYLDFPDRRVKLYPDRPEETERFLLDSGFGITDRFETEFAYVFVGEKA